MNNVPEGSTGSDQRSEMDRLIEALEPHPAVAAPEEGVDVVYVLDAELGQVVTLQVKHTDQSGVHEAEQVQPNSPAPANLHYAILHALNASKEREITLTALAHAVVERLRDDSVSELEKRLEETVQKLEADREHSAQIEGEREPDDPFEILKVLPERYHEWFLADYRNALRSAYPAEGFLALKRMLGMWRLRAEQYASLSYQTSLAEVMIARDEKKRPPGWRRAEEVHERRRTQDRPA